MGGRRNLTKTKKVMRRNGSGSLGNAPPSATEERWIRDIQRALSVDLLAPAYRGFADPTDHYVRGHCYVATEALYYLYGRDAGYKACFASTGKHVTHWWLVHLASGRILDPTAPQVTKDFNYTAGTRKGFQQPSPNRRTCELMRRVWARRVGDY